MNALLFYDAPDLCCISVSGFWQQTNSMASCIPLNRWHQQCTHELGILMDFVSNDITSSDFANQSHKTSCIVPASATLGTPDNRSGLLWIKPRRPLTICLYRNLLHSSQLSLTSHILHLSHKCSHNDHQDRWRLNTFCVVSSPIAYRSNGAFSAVLNVNVRLYSRGSIIYR